MSRDSVRYGRVPKRPREEPEPEPEMARAVSVPEPPPPAPVEEPDTEMPSMEITNEMYRTMITAHRNNNTYTEELRRMLQIHLMELDFNDLKKVNWNKGAGPSGSDENQEDITISMTVILIWYNVSFRMTPSVQEVVEFAKRVPGFHTLSQDDQLILVKLGFIEIWMTRASRLVNPNSVVFDDGASVSRAQLSTIYDDQFVEGMLTYMHSMAVVAPTENEIAVFSAILLMCPNRAGLVEGQYIASIKASLIDGLRGIMVEEGVQDVPARLSKFLALAEKVNALSARHHVLLSFCREHWRQLLMPPLFAEIFDIPKNSEECPPPPSSYNPKLNVATTSQTQAQE